MTLICSLLQDYSYSMFESCGVESQLIDIEGELDAFRNQWRDELRLRAAVLLPGGDETEQEAGLDNERNDLPTIEDQVRLHQRDEDRLTLFINPSSVHRPPPGF